MKILSRKRDSGQALTRFWIIALPLLIVWGAFLYFNNHLMRQTQFGHGIAHILPIDQKKKIMMDIAGYVFATDGSERTFAIALQDKNILRYGIEGGLIKEITFVTIRDGKIVRSNRKLVSDYNETFDVARIQKSGKDSGFENITNIIALNKTAQETLMTYGTPQHQNTSLADILEDLAALSLVQARHAISTMTQHAQSKDMKMIFSEDVLQNKISAQGWDGGLDRLWEKDFLAVIDTNKSDKALDQNIRRTISYDVDLTQNIPHAKLRLTYRNTSKDPYTTRVHIYVPQDAWFVLREQHDETSYGNAFNKRFISFDLTVSPRASQTAEIEYNLPRELKNVYPYDLKIQKQSGVDSVDIKLQVMRGDGMQENHNLTMEEDIILNKL